jgi:hypothetical protein
VRRRLAAFAAFAYQAGMAKKNKRTGRHADRGAAGDRGWEFSPWEPALALVPCRIGTKPVVDGTGFGGGGLAVKVELGPPDPIDIGVDAEKLKSVYEALGPMPYGGWHTRALQEVAEKIGMEPKTLQQRFDRLED